MVLLAFGHAGFMIPVWGLEPNYMELICTCLAEQLTHTWGMIDNKASKANDGKLT